MRIARYSNRRMSPGFCDSVPRTSARFMPYRPESRAMKAQGKRPIWTPPFLQTLFRRLVTEAIASLYSVFVGERPRTMMVQSHAEASSGNSGLEGQTLTQALPRWSYLLSIRRLDRMQWRRSNWSEARVLRAARVEQTRALDRRSAAD
jgi:hypothetical protein